ncbi:calmodulin-lysine N-methyltransferase-like, partial [Trifolium medium]|nr:calmodulin-lysine N-methyltransferase-like [Trifolium medium]
TQRNIEANSGAFGDTVVKSMMLHWNQEDTSSVADTFDIIVASDCSSDIAVTCKPPATSY